MSSILTSPTTSAEVNSSKAPQPQSPQSLKSKALNFLCLVQNCHNISSSLHLTQVMSGLFHEYMPESQGCLLLFETQGLEDTASGFGRRVEGKWFRV